MTEFGYGGAVSLLPPRLREAALRLDAAAQRRAEEIRLRAGAPPGVVLPEGERTLGGEPIMPRELDTVVEIATGASLHTARESVRAGYINARGGYRLGLCGTAVTEKSGIMGFRALSSIAIRIPHEAIGVSDVLAEKSGGRLRSTLIISPPGMGKTTFLRDLIRTASNGAEKFAIAPSRVALADERGEIAAVIDGCAQLEVGRHTDILSSCPKADAVMLLLRAMNPEIIALDEITDPADVIAIERAANCGVRIFATVHAGSQAELRRKELYRKMLAAGVFETTVTIKKLGGAREYEVEGMQC